MHICHYHGGVGMNYTASLLQSAGRCRIKWEKYNINTGEVEQLNGLLISAGVAEKAGKTEYAIIEDDAGRCWITIPEVVREIL
jgi:hypothetical protein